MNRKTGPFQNAVLAAWRRETAAYFTTPLAYVFILLFITTLTLFTWDLSNFFEAGRADLSAMFYWLPWLYVLFMPALAMRLWADESLSGTSELVLSLPVSISGIIIGKLLAALGVAALALALTFPWWIVVNYLGTPDNVTIAISYLMALLMALAYLSLGLTLSALTRSAVLAFVAGVVIGFALTAAGWPLVTKAISGLMGTAAGDAVAAFSFLQHFENAQRGVLSLPSLVFFIGFTALAVTLTTLLINHKRTVGR